MNVKLVVFDWSGVISDDRKPVYAAGMKMLKHFNKPIMSFEEWLSKTTMTAVEFLINNGVDERPDKLFDLYKHFLNETIANGTAPIAYPDASNVLNYIKSKGIRTAVLSSHPTENLLKEAESYKIIDMFDIILSSSSNKIQGLKDICSQLNIDIKNVLFIGDTIYDIRSAKKAGVISAGICTGYHAKERLENEKPDFLFTSLSDLKSLGFLNS